MMEYNVLETDLHRLRYKAYFLILFLSVIVFAANGIVAPYLSILAKNLGASYFLIGMVTSGYWFTRTIAEIPTGFISDKLGRRIPIIISMLLCLGGALGCFLAINVFGLISARCFWALGAAMFNCAAMALIIDLFAEKRRGAVLGPFIGIRYAGSLVGRGHSPQAKWLSPSVSARQGRLGVDV